MTASTLQRSLLPAIFAGGTIFTAIAFPFALNRSQVVGLEVQNQPVLSTELKNLSAPYLGVAGTISATVGLGILGISGWRHAASKAEAAEAQVSKLQKELLFQKGELERIKFSEARLQAYNLDSFVEAKPAMVAKPTMSVGEALSMPQPAAKMPTPVAARSSYRVETTPAIANLASEYTYSQPPASKPEATQDSDNQLNQLMQQLQVLTSQIEQMRETGSERLVA